MFRVTKGSGDTYFAVEISSVEDAAADDIESLVNDSMPVILFADEDDMFENLGEDNVEILD